MSIRPFVRQLGAQPGVQLNPLADTTDSAVPDNTDQIVGAVARLSRGRIDRPFRVNRGNFISKTGKPESIRVNALNEAKLQIYEALNNGAYEAVVQRLVPAAAAKSYALINLAATTAFTTNATVPANGWSIAVLHHECHNDGIKLSIHADQTPVGGVPVINPTLTLRILDSDGLELYIFTGSVDPLAKDDYGRSTYLPDVVSAATDAVEVQVATGTTGVLTTSDAYGRGTDGRDKWATSATLVCFNESSTTYATSDYDRVVQALRDTNLPFGRLISGGTPVLTLLSKLIQVAVEINKPIGIDLPGTLSPAGAIALATSLSVDTHYVQMFWAPMIAEDPVNGGRYCWGSAGLHAGFSCARNARVNAKGFAPKNYPVAGKAWPINRVAITPSYQPSEQELSDLARSQINPVIFENYSGGGRYVYSDSLTGAKVQTSWKKLSTVAEMSMTLDDWVTLAAKELMLLPMEEFIKRMKIVMETILSGAEASKWLKPAKNLENNASYKFTVEASEVRPADMVLINYWTSFDGVARQVIVQQTLTR